MAVVNIPGTPYRLRSTPLAAVNLQAVVPGPNKSNEVRHKEFSTVDLLDVMRMSPVKAKFHVRG
jgi:hypothetical protein